MGTIAAVARTMTPAEPVGSFMTRNVVTLERNQTLELADQLMTFDRIGCARIARRPGRNAKTAHKSEIQ